MTTVLDVGRITELKNSLKAGAPWGATIEFLDSINSAEELEEIIPFLSGIEYSDMIGFYRKNLTRWKNPQLPAGFKEKCPLLTARLDTPQKVRILLRGADFRGVDPLLMGEVLEDIVRRHEMQGEKKVVYARHRGGYRDHENERYAALRTVYHTQLQAWTLTKLALPGHTTIEVSSSEGLIIDWRTKEERKAAGES